MKLDLERIPSGRSDLVAADEVRLEWADRKPVAVQVTGTLVVDNLEARILVSGTVVATGVAACSRCLEDFTLTWDVDVSCLVLRDVDATEGQDDLMVVHQQNDMVDLTEILRESVVLAYPLAPVCLATCRGLCPGCGHNLNKEACVCEPEAHDPRWDALP